MEENLFEVEEQAVCSDPTNLQKTFKTSFVGPSSSTCMIDVSDVPAESDLDLVDKEALGEDEEESLEGFVSESKSIKVVKL